MVVIGPLYEVGQIGDGAALAVALLLGTAFGWFLERGGLGNARKLAGQFYLTDFTVFKVMFSAILTAMLGLFWLGRLGVVDVARVYVPETYLLPQLVGGLVFGAGFVVGGLCPGTSCVAAATGRLDGLALVAGMLGGIWLFGEAFPLVERFYGSTPRGTLTIPSLLGVSQGIVVFAVVAMAVGAFVGAGRLEVRGARCEVSSVGALKPRTSHREPRYLAISAAVLGFLALGVGDPYPAARDQSAERSVSFVTALDVARWIRDGRADVRVVDVRADSLFDAYHIPRAEHVTLGELQGYAWRPDQIVVVYADNDAAGAAAAMTVHKRGVANTLVLRGGLPAWVDVIVEPRLTTLPATATPDEQTARREQLELSRYFGGTPMVSPTAAPVPVVRRPPLPAPDPRSEAAAVARIIRRGC
jgi:rhodanese-related sulfurtransferase